MKEKDNYPTFRKELGLPERSPEALAQIKTDIANGKLVKDDTSVTSTSISAIAFAVPPVETILTLYFLSD